MLQRICIILKQNQTHKAKQNQPTTPSQKKTKKNQNKTTPLTSDLYI